MVTSKCRLVRVTALQMAGQGRTTVTSQNTIATERLDKPARGGALAASNRRAESEIRASKHFRDGAGPADEGERKAAQLERAEAVEHRLKDKRGRLIQGRRCEQHEIGSGTRGVKLSGHRQFTQRGCLRRGCANANGEPDVVRR